MNSHAVTLLSEVINQGITMNFKTLTVSIVALLAITAPAVANPNWKVFGKSNGGSEIALDLNGLAASGDIVYFQYRTTKNGKTTKHTGGTNLCSNKNPAAWLAIHPDGSAPSAVVSADSPASKAMLKNVCQVFNSASKSKSRSPESCQRSRETVTELRSTLAGSPNDRFTEYFRGSIDILEETGKLDCPR